MSTPFNARTNVERNETSHDTQGLRSLISALGDWLGLTDEYDAAAIQSSVERVIPEGQGAGRNPADELLGSGNVRVTTRAVRATDTASANVYPLHGTSSARTSEAALRAQIAALTVRAEAAEAALARVGELADAFDDAAVFDPTPAQRRCAAVVGTALREALTGVTAPMSERVAA